MLKGRATSFKANVNVMCPVDMVICGVEVEGLKILSSGVGYKLIYYVGP